MNGKPEAIFLCDNPETIARVYDTETRVTLGQCFDLRDGILTGDALAAQAPLSGVQAVFSTWGMPALDVEQIRAQLPDLRWVFYGAGSVQYFARPFLAAGMRVFSAWGANAVPVAEYAVAQILMANKGFFQGLRRQQTGGRQAFTEYHHCFPGNYSIRIGVLGAGMIGKMVVSELRRHALEVLVYDPFVGDEWLKQAGARRASLEDIFSTCQTITNHIANLPSTVGMLDYASFSRMLPNATFVNTGRGAQVVEDDLIRALRECPDRTAVLDVTWPEPPDEGSPLLTMENVILTPHIAGSTSNEVARMGAYMLEEAQRVLAGESAKWEVTEKMLETMA